MISSLLVALVALLVAAKLGGALAERLGQPAVLGELLAGVAIGALPLLGVGGLAFVATDTTVEALAGLGVILLLFEVGLATRLADLMKVGLSALLVATIGVVVPMALGFLVGRWLLPDHHWFSALFLGATLCATSVGITARVLTDLGRVATPEGQIILGAAVIDDVMGLIVLAVMAGLAGGGAAASGRAAWAGAAACGARDFPFFEPVQPPRPFQVMVHRGEAHQAPENTRPAIVRCIEDGLEWAEVDVRLTKDGHHVLAHGDRLPAGTNGAVSVAAHTLEELKQLDLQWTLL